MLDRHSDRAGRSTRRLFFLKLRKQLIELPHLSGGSPAEIAITRIPQIHTCKLLKSAPCVKACGKLVSERFVVHEAIGLSRADGLFVEVHGITITALDPCDLRADQCGAGFEILR